MIVTRTPDAKRATFVDTARELFFAGGYAGTSMSSVAAKVGGSKTTLWSYFPSKEALFAAVVDDLVEHYGQKLDRSLDAGLDLPDALRVFGAGTMGVAMSPPVLALNRLVIGEASRFPELGALLHDRTRGTASLAAWLTTAMNDGRVRRGDPHRAASQFAAMCQAGVHAECLLALKFRATADEIAGDIEAAVDAFVRAWGI